MGDTFYFNPREKRCLSKKIKYKVFYHYANKGFVNLIKEFQDRTKLELTDGISFGGLSANFSLTNQRERYNVITENDGSIEIFLVKGDEKDFRQVERSLAKVLCENKVPYEKTG